MILVTTPRTFAAWLSILRSWCARVASITRSAVIRRRRLTYGKKVREARDLIIVPIAAQSIARVSEYMEILWTAEWANCKGVLIDLTQVRIVKLAFFDALATEWGSDRQVVKLGVRVTFDQWARLYRAIMPHQQHLAAKGVKLTLFYEDQDYLAWYREDRLVHDAEAVINRLRTTSELSIRWPVLLDAVVSLLDGYGPHRRAEALVALSRLALDCGVDKKALAFAHEALLYHKLLSPALECRARCVLGESLILLGQNDTGLASIACAIEVGSAGGAKDEAAWAACVLASNALYRQDYTNAERHYQQALNLLGHEPSELSGRIHAGLGMSLFRQGKDSEATKHMDISCEMRNVSASSSSSEVDMARALRMYIRDSRKPRQGGSQS